MYFFAWNALPHMIQLFETSAIRRKRLNSVRCVFCDLDGTLLTNDNTIHPDVVNAGRILRSAGVRIVLASGRTDGFTRQFTAEMDADAPVISLNGALVKTADGRVLDARVLPSTLQRTFDSVHQSIPGASLAWSLFTADGIFSLDERPILPRYLRSFIAEIHRVADLTPYYDHAVTICAAGPYQAIQRLSVTLARRYGPRLFRVVYQSGSGEDRYYLELRLKTVSKASGMRAVLAHLGLSRRVSAAIGDYTNDVEMCKFSGVSAAMSNAGPALRQHVDFITKRNNNDGGAAEFFRLMAGSKR